jgi:hypothetical protein
LNQLGFEQEEGRTGRILGWGRPTDEKTQKSDLPDLPGFLFKNPEG